MGMFGKKKPVEEATTSVINNSNQNDKIIEDVVTKEEKQPEIELDQQEVGLINNYRSNLAVQLQIIETLQKINDTLERIEKKG